MKVQLANAVTSPNTGTVYFNTKLDFIGREARVVINPRWKAAYDEAIKNKTRCSQPSFNLIVIDMEREDGKWDGTGSVWRRGDGKHSGTFQWDGKTFNMQIERGDAEGTFELSLEEIQPVNLGDL